MHIDKDVKTWLKMIVITAIESVVLFIMGAGVGALVPCLNFANAIKKGTPLEEQE